MGKSKSYLVQASFTRIASAIEAVGVIKYKGLDDAPRVLSGGGRYYTVMGPFKAKKTCEDLIARLHEETTYSFIIEEEKSTPA